MLLLFGPEALLWRGRAPEGDVMWLPLWGEKGPDRFVGESPRVYASPNDPLCKAKFGGGMIVVLRSFKSTSRG